MTNHRTRLDISRRLLKCYDAFSLQLLKVLFPSACKDEAYFVGSGPPVAASLSLFHSAVWMRAHVGVKPLVCRGRGGYGTSSPFLRRNPNSQQGGHNRPC
jgi:hypothetical protein